MISRILRIIFFIPTLVLGIDINVSNYGNLTQDQREVVDASITFWEQSIPQLSDHVVNLTFNNVDLGTEKAIFIPGVEFVTIRAGVGSIDIEGATLAHAINFTYNGDNRPTGALIEINNNTAITWYVGVSGPVPANQHDLLTVLYHEICHALGFTVSCQRFSRNVTSGPGNNRTYNQGKQPTATLTPVSQATHLDPSTHPNDLMNPSIGLGVRRTPSQLDIDLLNHDVWAIGATIAYILDRSGSMTGTPLANAKSAANQGITSMNSFDQVAVVSFSSTATVNYSRTEITSDAIRTAARNAVNGLSAGGNTSIGAGLLAGYNELVSSNSDVRDYVLLSDGMENTPPWVADVIHLFQNLIENTTVTHHIHAIAFGPGANQQQMSQIAALTGGIYLFIPTQNDPLGLANIFNTIQNQISGLQTLASFENSIIAPGEHSYPFTINTGISEETVTLLWDDISDALSLELDLPDGTTINSSNWQTFPGVTEVTGPAIKYFKMETPVTGNWTARVIAESTVGSSNYALIFTANSTITMEVAFDKIEYSVNEPILVSAELKETGIPITGATVTANVMTPTSQAALILNPNAQQTGQEELVGNNLNLQKTEDGKSYINEDGIVYYTESILSLFDDGAHGDGAANDGIYANYFTETGIPGSYTFHVTASGNAPISGPFTREATRATVVHLIQNPVISIVPNALTFDIPANGSASDTLTISNFGAMTLNWTITEDGDCSWITETPPSGSITTGNSQDVEIAVDASGLAQGSYQCNLLIDSNDPAKPQVVVTVTLNVSPSVIHPYVLLANEDIEFKRHAYSEGDMHSNEDIEFSKGNPTTHTGNLTAVVDVEIAQNNTINGDVTAGGEVDNKGTVNGTITQNATVTPVSLPTIPLFMSGSQDVEVPKNGSLTLPPGDYADVEVRENGTLTLISGVYNLVQIEMSKNSNLVIDIVGGDPLTINLVEEIEFNKDVEMSINNGATADVTINSTYPKTMHFRDRSTLLGTINAPFAKITLQKNTGFKGAICAREIEVQRAVTILHHTSTTPLPKILPGEGEDDEETITALPTVYELSQNYPNPFNPATTIRFALPEAGAVSLKIYNLRGQLVKTLASGHYEAGYHQVQWDAANEFGDKVASGFYFYSIQAGSFHQVKKMLLIK